MAFYQALKATGSPILKAAYHPWIRGQENLPAAGPAILASNHGAVWDSVFLPMMLDREVVFMGKADYFTGTGFKGWMTKEFMRAVGTIPVDRSGGRASEAALNAGLKRLRSGELFGIYPEGTRSPDGRLYRGKTGVARLALLSGAPVIPVAMIGTHAAQPIGQKVPSRTNIGMPSRGRFPPTAAPRPADAQLPTYPCRPLPRRRASRRTRAPTRSNRLGFNAAVGGAHRCFVGRASLAKGDVGRVE